MLEKRHLRMQIKDVFPENSIFCFYFFNLLSFFPAFPSERDTAGSQLNIGGRLEFEVRVTHSALWSTGDSAESGPSAAPRLLRPLGQWWKKHSWRRVCVHIAHVASKNLIGPRPRQLIIVERLLINIPYQWILWHSSLCSGRPEGSVCAEDWLAQKKTCFLHLKVVHRVTAKPNAFLLWLCM